MSLGNLPPFLKSILTRFDQRLGNLERKLQTVALPPVTASTTPPCCYPGEVANGVESPRFYGPAGLTLTYDTCRISANTPAAGTLSVDVKLNGSTLFTVSLVSSDDTAVYTTGFSKADGDYLTCETVAVGGQLDVSIELNEVSAA